MKPITAQEIVDILEARYAELEARYVELEKAIDEMPEEWIIRHEYDCRLKEVSLLLLTINTRGG